MLFSSASSGDGWDHLEQHGIAIPRKWVDNGAEDDDSVCTDNDTMNDMNANGRADTITFVGQDVRADGNCLLRCFAQSGLLPYDYQEIRQALLHTAHTDADFGKLAYERSFDDRPYEEYLQESLAVDGEWTGDFEMLLFSKTFGINVVSFTMSPFGLICFNADEYVREAMHLPSTNPQATIYVLHHEHGYPLGISEKGNHFCLLLPAVENVHPIFGNRMDPSRAFQPTTTTREALPHDTSKFTGNGTSRMDPLQECDDDKRVETTNKNPVKRKAPSLNVYRDAKRMTTTCARELLTPFPLQRGKSLLEKSPLLIRDSWYPSPMERLSLFGSRIQRLSSVNSIYDDFLF